MLAKALSTVAELKVKESLENHFKSKLVANKRVFWERLKLRKKKAIEKNALKNAEQTCERNLLKEKLF